MEKSKQADNSNAEIKRLQRELKRVTEERDILKKAAVYFASHTN
jgi:transposase